MPTKRPVGMYALAGVFALAAFILLLSLSNSPVHHSQSPTAAAAAVYEFFNGENLSIPGGKPGVGNLPGAGNGSQPGGPGILAAQQQNYTGGYSGDDWQYNRTEATNLGVRLHAPVLFMDFNKPDEDGGFAPLGHCADVPDSGCSQWDGDFMGCFNFRYNGDAHAMQCSYDWDNSSCIVGLAGPLTCGAQTSGALTYDSGYCTQISGCNWYLDPPPTYVQDDSVYDNYGKNYGVTWNTTGGLDGSGAYSFNGIDDYIEATVTQTHTSYAFWYKNRTSAWTFVVDADGVFYVNGELATPVQYPIYVSGNTIDIGKTGASTYFNGTIDNVQIWNRNLTAQEVLNLYDGTGSGNPLNTNGTDNIGKYAYNGDFKSEIFFNLTNSTYWKITLGIADSGGQWTTKDLCDADPNCVSYWPLDGNFSDVKDGNDGTPSSPPPNSATGISSEAMRFDGYEDRDGNHGSYIELPTNAASLSPGTGDFAISAWFKTSETGRTKYIYDDYDDFGNALITIYVDSSDHIFGTYRDTTGSNSVDVNPSTSVTDGNWHNVVWIRNGTSGTMYLDDVMYTTDNPSLGDIAVDDPIIPPQIGRYYYPSSSDGFRWNGFINEVLVYNRALSAGDVGALYKAGLSQHARDNITLQVKTATSYTASDPGLTSRWHFEGNYNDAQKLHNFTCSSCPTYTPDGKVGGAYNYNGAGNYLSTATGISANHAFSICTWIKSAGGDGYTVWTMGLHGHNSVAFLINSGGRIVGELGAILVFSIDASVWTFVCYTYDGSSGSTVYVNDNPPQTASSSLNLGSSTLYLGTWYNVGVYYFNGIIDEVSFWNRTINASEVANMYTYSHNFFSIDDWSDWTTPHVMRDGVAYDPDAQGKFMQFKANFETNDTNSSAYLLSHSVAEFTPGCVGATTTFQCGDTVTESCTMNANMHCSGTALYIGADDITINGAGFTITGDINASGTGTSDTSGYCFGGPCGGINNKADCELQECRWHGDGNPAYTNLVVNNTTVVGAVIAIGADSDSLFGHGGAGGAITITGGSTITSIATTGGVGGENDGWHGGNGGAVTITSSTITGTITTAGGTCDGGFGGAGGAVRVNDSNITAITTAGGSGGYSGTGGVGGLVTMTNSNTTTITTSGGRGGGNPAGNGGAISISNSNVTTIIAKGGDGGAGGVAGTGGAVIISSNSIIGTITTDGGIDGGGLGGAVNISHSTVTAITALGGDLDHLGGNNGMGGLVTISNNSIIGTITTTGGKMFGGLQPGTGGAVTISNSNITTIIATGGEGGGNGGAVTVNSNSTIGTITTAGATGMDYVGNGGSITITDSDVRTITTAGGNSFFYAGGTGGNVTITNSFLNLSNILITLTGGTGSPNGADGTLKLIQTSLYNTHGAIKFKYVSTTETALNLILSIAHNYAYVDSADYGDYNTSANITLTGSPGFGLSTPLIFRNGAVCNDITIPRCHNFTSLVAPTVRFNVSGWSNYTIGELPPPCPGSMLGNGTAGSPCQVTSWTDLNATRAALNIGYILMHNLSSSTPGYSGLGNNWMPIGNCGGDYCNNGDNPDIPFAGSFNGNGNTISNLRINLPSTKGVGLFGYSTGNISNIGLINVSVSGSQFIGGLVGWQTSGTISNSYSTGNISGSDGVNVNVGGLVGGQWGGTISKSYSTGSVSGYWNVGGLVGGQFAGTVSNSYSTGRVSSSGSYIGGLVGSCDGTILKSYSTGRVSGAVYVGGLTGYSDGTVSDSYWDNESSGQSGSAAGIGKTTRQMKTLSTFSAWNISSSSIYLNNGYPYLAWQASNDSYVWLIYKPPFSVSWNWTDRDRVITRSWTELCANSSDTMQNCTFYIGSAYSNSTNSKNICRNVTISTGNHTGVYARCYDLAGKTNITTTSWIYSSICGNSLVESGEQCDDGANNGASGYCCDSSCNFRLSSYTCRASAGICDIPDKCTGISGGACPTDAFNSSSTVCRPNAGVCDKPENCTGSSAACPADVHNTTSTCRASAGTCDVAETCGTNGVNCPTNAFRPLGYNCSDGLFCNGNETCNAFGSCMGGTPVNCSDSVACTLDSCSVDHCAHSLNDSLCPSDAWFDNGTTRWTSTGQCTEKQEKAQEYRDYSCALSGCTYSVTSHQWVDTGSTRNKADSTPCNDSLYCTVSDVCSTGVCSGSARNCSDGNPLTSDSCNEATDTCDHTLLLYCGDGSCNNGETCSSCPTDCGSCASTDKCAGVNCDDSNPCTTDSCNPSNGECTHTNNANSCNDGSACTTSDHCSAGSCSGTPLTCDDSNPCTTDSCSPSTGCVFTNNANACDDSNPCTTGDTCSAGSCIGTPMDCDDGVACTTDSCVAGACQHDASGCACTTSGDCPARSCNLASCVNNTCAYAPLDGASCDDSSACTKNDTCIAGACRGSPITCSDNNTCTDDTCDPLAGCVFTDNSNPCSDNDNCTSNDYCMNGVCTSGQYTCACTANADCNDNNPCTEDICTLGQCIYTNVPGSCDDGKDCTINDYCDKGKCVPGENDCGTACLKEWACDWGACINNTQSMVCTCACRDQKCKGQKLTGTQQCGQVTQTLALGINLSTNEGLKVGDILKIRVTDENGNPIEATIILIRPDGTNVTITGNEYVVDQAGVWKVVVKKAGYKAAETEAVISEKPLPPQPTDLGAQMTKAVEDVVNFVTKEPVRFALLLVTVLLLLGLVIFVRKRKKQNIEKI